MDSLQLAPYGNSGPTRPYEFKGCGARDGNLPYEFIGFGTMDSKLNS